MFDESISQKLTPTISFKIEVKFVKLNDAMSTSEREDECLRTVRGIGSMD